MPRAERLAAAAALLLAGCAALAPPPGPVAAPVFRDPALTAQAAHDAIAVGRSTKAEVAARLGEGEALRFDSGYEVWVYRSRDPQRAAQAPELVVLFAPSGLVHKLRLRPASPAAPP